MKKAMLVLTLFLVAAMPAYAKQHSSDFGFTMDIPDGWLVLGREEVKKNPDLFNFDNPQLSGMSKDVIADIRLMPCRAPVASTTGVSPFLPQVRPAWWSDLMCAASPK